MRPRPLRTESSGQSTATRWAITEPIVERNANGLVVDAKGRPLTAKDGTAAHWSDRRAVRTGEYIRNPELNRLPDLTPDALLAMGASVATGRTKQAKLKAMRHVLKALDMMNAERDLVFADLGNGIYRIEPPDWWGNPDGGTK